MDDFKFLDIFTKHHFDKYETAIAFLCRYLYDKKFFEYYSRFTYNANVKHYTELDFQIEDIFLHYNARLMNKLFRDLVLIIYQSNVVISKKNIFIINKLFNRYCRMHTILDDIKKSTKNKHEQKRKQIRDSDFFVNFQPNMLWKIYYKKMKVLENRYIYYKCLLRKKIGVAKEQCNLIGEYLYPPEDILHENERFQPISYFNKMF